MAEPRYYVRLDTGHGPMCATDTPIELHGANCDGMLRLSAEAAEDLARQLNAAVAAVRVLKGEPATDLFRHASIPSVWVPPLNNPPYMIAGATWTPTVTSGTGAV